MKLEKGEPSWLELRFESKAQCNRKNSVSDGGLFRGSQREYTGQGEKSCVLLTIFVGYEAPQRHQVLSLSMELVRFIHSWTYGGIHATLEDVAQLIIFTHSWI